MLQTKTWLTETEELARELDAPDIVVIDASWHMPSEGRDAYGEYLEGHIPGAIFFDIDEIADTKSTLPHMLPAPEKFSSRMRSMGIGDGSRIVIYDSRGLFSAARVWWMFRVMGVDDVSVLNGGLPKWKEEGRPLESGPPPPRTTRHFTARRNADLDVFNSLQQASCYLPGDNNNQVVYSMCGDAIWEFRATATDAVTGAETSIRQGVSVLTSLNNVDANCPI